MQQILEFMKNNDIGFMATVNNGKPALRPIQYQFEKDGKLYFLTTNDKPFYDELKECNYVSYTALNPDTNWVRINGEVTFEDNRALIEEIFENRPYIKSLYKTVDNPILELIYISNGDAQLILEHEVVEEAKF